MDDNVKVLLIEDDAAAAEMYRLRLAADGYAVVVGRDGEEGLRMAAEEAPDFIYLDLRLPGLDGFEVLERLRGDPATTHIPVIILSNYGEPELRERGLKLGALEFLVKADTTPAQLSTKVEQSRESQALPSADPPRRAEPSRHLARRGAVHSWSSSRVMVLMIRSFGIPASAAAATANSRWRFGKMLRAVATTARPSIRR